MNNTKADYFNANCIYQLFEEQVEKSPDSVAVVFEEEKLTYNQLNNKANQLAHYLQKLGVGPEILVGICIERSLEMVIGLLGILKAGGAYVPLDPHYPQERIHYMLEDSGTQVLLTQSVLLASIPSHNAEVVCLDSDWMNIALEPQSNLDIPINLDNLAYVIYTSGSTGKPKGVMITHQAICNHMLWMQTEFPLTSSDKVLQKTPFSFDASVWEFYAPLLVGGQLVMARPRGHQDGNYLIQEIREKQVTILQLVPTLLQILLEHRDVSTCISLRNVFCGGEALPFELQERFFANLNAELHNLYGPTEACIDATFYTCKSGINHQLVPIGRPIANIYTYILDEHLKHLPIGVIGELHIGGIGLARGYLNRPELTAEKFIPNPFQSGERLYKTGDLARYLPDGNIEYLGRIDDQVKIRGFRIELGEIEALLNSHLLIQQAIVIAREDDSGDKKLVAYLLTNSKSLDNGQLRSFLKEKLPDFMIPSFFVILESLPLTPNGKIDRKKLPSPDYGASSEDEYVAPRNSLEQKIANIWAEALKIKRVGINKDFFALGGHSISAIQVINRLSKILEIELSLKFFFKAPTLAEFSEYVETILRESQIPQKNEIPPISTPIIQDYDNQYKPFPLTDVQQAYWLGRRKDFLLGNIDTHSYQELDCPNLNLVELTRAWNKLITHHQMLRVIILPSGEQKVLEKVPFYEFETIDLRTYTDQERSEKLEEIRAQISHEMLSEEEWPLFKIRATLIDKQTTRLHLSFYALISDAWSLMLLKQQWQQLYTNSALVLPKIEISFRDYVISCLSLKEKPEYQLSKEYWTDRELPAAPELPLSFNLSSVVRPIVKRYRAKLKTQEWEQIKQKAMAAQLTPSIVLLTAFTDILNFWSKNSDFTVNLTTFNRPPLHPDLLKVVGDFASVTLLEVSNRENNTFIARAQKVQRQLWQDLDYRYFNGLEVQKELRRKQINTQPMGVVFTSTLGLDSLHRNESIDFFGEEIYSISQTPQVWLDHMIYEVKGELILYWDVVEELYPPRLIDDMVGAYCNWLLELANSESAWRQDKPNFLPKKQLELISLVNNTTSPIAPETLHELFRQQVNKRAQFPAILSPCENLTYQELDQLANNLGHQLRALGATPNNLIAVIMEKGWEQVVAVLGILMSGAAYLPISAKYPLERINYLLKQGQVKIAITQPHLLTEFTLPANIDCLTVSREQLNSELTPLEFIQNPGDLAYVIYTSGSTGLPKGVAIDHRGAVNTVLDINERFEVGNEDRVLALSALEFDLSVYDIFGILAAGGAIVFPEALESIGKDPAHWLELMKRHQVTLWNTVPTYMQMMFEHLLLNHEQKPGNLRLALLSGDWIPLSLPEQIQSYWKDVQVVSLGGATEASIWSIIYPIEKIEPHWKSIPYGKPMKNQNFYVLNQAMQPTPTWVPGELYIGGIGLAKEYWRDQIKTQASFIDHPVTQERLYKTGDLGRYLPDGNIDFIGRIDNQIKINGFRVELGEIEATLKSHALIEKTVVIIREDIPDNKILAAYIVVEDRALEIKNLVTFLKSKLPHYMVPSAFVLLESLPLTSNGKIDRKNLPIPDIAQQDCIEDFVEPRNPLEQKIADIWREILKVERVSVHHNFFALGGHSLTATQAINRLCKDIGIKLFLRNFFEFPTIAELSQHTEMVRWASQITHDLNNYEFGEDEIGEI